MITNNLVNTSIHNPTVKNFQGLTKNFVQKSVQNLEPTLMKSFLLDREVGATSHKLAQQKAEKLIDKLF